MEEMPKRKKRRRRKAKAAKRRKLRQLAMTPKERYDAAVTLKRAIRCMLKVEDRYMVYNKLTEDFAALAALPEEETFEGKETCAALSEECRARAEELKPELPDKPEGDSRTVTKTVKKKKKGKGKWVALLAVVLIAGIVLAFHMDGSRYVIAFVEKGVGFKDEAKGMFESLGDYRDSEAQAAEMERILLSEAKKGDEVMFGKTEWIVLDKSQRAVCIMKLAGEKHLLYHDREEAVSWESCDARKFLNGAYVSDRFSDSEQAMIRQTEVPVAENRTYRTAAGAPTSDRVFILASHDVKKYKKVIGNRGNNMRLRNPGKEGLATEFVSGTGEVVDYGYPVNQAGILIHPVMWIGV